MVGVGANWILGIRRPERTAGIPLRTQGPGISVSTLAPNLLQTKVFSLEDPVVVMFGTGGAGEYLESALPGPGFQWSRSTSRGSRTTLDKERGGGKSGSVSHRRIGRDLQLHKYVITSSWLRGLFPRREPFLKYNTRASRVLFSSLSPGVDGRPHYRPHVRACRLGASSEVRRVFLGVDFDSKPFFDMPSASSAAPGPPDTGLGTGVGPPLWLHGVRQGSCAKSSAQFG